MKQIFKLTAVVVGAIFVLSSCGANDKPSGPDLSGIDQTDQAYFTSSYNLCNINNTKFDCNCVARVNVDHRKTAYQDYTANYDSKYKPELDKKVADLSASIEEKEKNASDPRIIESMYEELDALKAEQADGMENIDNFKIPPLPYGATDRCIIAQN